MKLKKAIVTFALVVICIVGIAIVSSPVWMGWLLTRSQNKTYEAIRNVTLPCPPGTTQKIETWSKVGWSVSCRRGGIMHGPWQAWDAGHLVIEGVYSEGKESGTWFIYADDGKLYKTIKHEGAK